MKRASLPWKEKDKSRHQLQWMTLCRSQLEILLRFLNRSDQTSQLSERKCSISGANLAGSEFFWHFITEWGIFFTSPGDKQDRTMLSWYRQIIPFCDVRGKITICRWRFHHKTSYHFKISLFRDLETLITLPQWQITTRSLLYCDNATMKTDNARLHYCSQLRLCWVYILICQNVIKQSMECVMIASG